MSIQSLKKKAKLISDVQSRVLKEIRLFYLFLNFYEIINSFWNLHLKVIAFSIRIIQVKTDRRSEGQRAGSIRT